MSQLRNNSPMIPASQGVGGILSSRAAARGDVFIPVGVSNVFTAVSLRSDRRKMFISQSEQRAAHRNGSKVPSSRNTLGTKHAPEHSKLGRSVAAQWAEFARRGDYAQSVTHCRCPAGASCGRISKAQL